MSHYDIKSLPRHSLVDEKCEIPISASEVSANKYDNVDHAVELALMGRCTGQFHEESLDSPPGHAWRKSRHQPTTRRQPYSYARCRHFSRQPLLHTLDMFSYSPPIHLNLSFPLANPAGPLPKPRSDVVVPTITVFVFHIFASTNANTLRRDEAFRKSPSFASEVGVFGEVAVDLETIDAFEGEERL
jgi:hypothetical protein